MSEQPKVSALDLATASAVAFGRMGEAPRTQAWPLREAGSSVGARAHMMLGLLLAHLKDFLPELVAIEEPMAPAIVAKMGMAATSARFLPGLVVVAEAVCHSRGVETMLVGRQTVLKHFVGRARFSNKDDGKIACRVRCKQLGWVVNTDDEGDAAALWDYAASRVNPSAFLKLAVERPIFAT